MKSFRGILIAQVNTIKKKLTTIADKPRNVAMGYALGVFLATTPLIGIKVFIAIALTFLFKWNKVAAIIGVFHINPLTGPFFYSISFFIGKIILGTDLILDIDSLNSVRAVIEMFSTNSILFVCLILGGIILGTPLGFLAYLFSYRLVQKNKRIKTTLK